MQGENLYEKILAAGRFLGKVLTPERERIRAKVRQAFEGSCGGYNRRVVFECRADSK